MFILGANAAGLFNKKESLLRNISLFKPGVVFVQETKARRKNKLMLNEYITCELIRKENGGGGLLTAIHKSLKPVSVSNEDEEEILVVEATLIIDEAGKHSLTKYSNKTGTKEKRTESDHRTLILEVDLKWNPKQYDQENRVEIYNYKNNDNFEKFVLLTTENKDLKHCFDDEEEDLEKASKRWLKTVKNIIKTSFDKIRIKKNNLKPELEVLFQKKESLKSQIAQKDNSELFEEAMNLGVELNDVEEKISEICAAKNRAIVKEYLGDKNDTMEGFTHAKTWGMKKKLSPKNTIDPPAAKKDEQGNLVTSREALEDLYLRTYKSR